MLTSKQRFLHKLRNSWKWILFFILALPLGKWFLLAPLDVRFATIRAAARSFGQITGLVGTLLFSFSLILSYRNSIIETIFGGLDKLYRVHHMSGMYGFFLLLLHPLFLSVPLLMTSVEEAGRFFIPFLYYPVITPLDFGIVSILLFMILVGVTLFGVMFSYQSLKKVHTFMGLAFLFGAVHGFMIPSDIQNDMFIRVFVLGFVVLGLCSYLVYSLLSSFTVSKKIYYVSSIKKIRGGITEFFLKPQKKEKRKITHLPGQFAFFSFLNSNVVKNKESHPFTISSFEGNGDVVISVKALGDFTTAIQEEKVGSLVEIEGPFGEFVYLYGDLKQVWVAGGVGVTPFASFVEYMLKEEKCMYDIDFFYSVKTKEDLAFNELFSRAALKFPSFRYRPMMSDVDGFITGEGIAGKVSDLISRDIFICGPPPMMQAITRDLISRHIKKTQIHSELFSLLK